MSKLKTNGTKYPDKFYQTRDEDGDLDNYGDTYAECMKYVYVDSEGAGADSVEIAEYTLTSVKKYKLKVEAEEA